MRFVSSAPLRLIYTAIALAIILLPIDSHAQSIVINDCRGFTRAIKSVEPGVKENVQVNLSTTTTGNVPSENVVVRLESPVTGTVSSAQSVNGVVVFPDIPPGVYTLAVENPAIVLETVQISSVIVAPQVAAGVGIAAGAGGGAAAVSGAVVVNDEVKEITEDNNDENESTVPTPTPEPDITPVEEPTETPIPSPTPTFCPECDPDAEPTPIDDFFDGQDPDTLAAQQNCLSPYK